MGPAKSLYVRLFFLLPLLCALGPLSFAQIDIVTERYDQSRLGANLNETQLNISNINVNTFGKLSPATGWTIESQTNGATVCLLDRIVSATGSYQASVTASTAQNYAMALVTFK